MFIREPDKVFIRLKNGSKKYQVFGWGYSATEESLPKAVYLTAEGKLCTAREYTIVMPPQFFAPLLKPATTRTS